MIGKDFRRFATDKGCLVQFITEDLKAADRAFQNVSEDKEIEVIIRPKKKKRSLDANAYMWVLMDKIAQVLHTTKEEVYREIIRDVGIFDYMLMVDKAAPKFIEMWQSRGTGWIAEIEPSKIKGTTKIRCYYGSSTYDSKEMSRLIDETIYRATELGIETMPEEELKQLEKEWSRQ